jgi:hypothetical protein
LPSLFAISTTSIAAQLVAAARALRADPPDAGLQVMLHDLHTVRFADLDYAVTIAGLRLFDEDVAADLRTASRMRRRE